MVEQRTVQHSKYVLKEKTLFIVSEMDMLQNQSNLVPACLPTPNPSSPNFLSRFRADIVKLVETSNVHKHSDTCYKYSKANQDNKKVCRMRMPRKLVSVSSIDPETGHITMRRSDPMINNFNEYLIAACRSNMDIKFIWSGSDAKALVYYITDYVTKMSLSFHDTFALVQKSIASIMNSSNQTNNDNAIENPGNLFYVATTRLPRNKNYRAYKLHLIS